MTPRQLADLAHLHRNYFVSVGHDWHDCQIGLDSEFGLVMLINADGDGGERYQFRADGIIERRSDNRSRLVEFIATRLESEIAIYNRSVKQLQPN